MKKIIRMTESDLSRLVKKVVREQSEETPFKPMPGVKGFGEEKDGGKSELIRVLRNKLDSMSNNPKFDANAVAQVMYNNASHFLNKTDIFRDQNIPLSPKPTPPSTTRPRNN